MSDREAIVELSRLGSELLGLWYASSRAREKWQAVELGLFPDVRLREIAKHVNAGVDPEMLPQMVGRDGSGHLWPDPGAAIDMLVECPATGRSVTQLVDAMRAQREILDVRKGLALAIAKLDEDGVDKTIDELVKLRPSSAAGMLELSIEQMFQPLGPIPWVVKGLGIAPGAPAMLAGYGGKGKSWLAQTIALSVASGRDIGGHLPVKKGRVVHLDYEQGKRETSARYQRLARGLDIGPSDLEGNLKTYIHPQLMMNDSRSEETLIRLCDGFDLCIVDSLSASTSGLDENKSEMRAPIDVMSRVSERLQCSFLILHHIRKPGSDDKEFSWEDLEYAIRGSSAIQNACGSIWVFHQPPRSLDVNIGQVKARASKRANPLSMSIVDITADPGDPAFGGVEIRIDEVPEDNQERQVTLDRHRVMAESQKRIVAYLKGHPNASTTMVHNEIGIRKTALLGCLDGLVYAGHLEAIEGKRGSKTWVLTESGAALPD